MPQDPAIALVQRYIKGDLSRRQFLQRSGAAAAAVGLAPFLSRVAKAAEELVWIQFEGISDPAFLTAFTDATIKSQGLVSEAAVAGQIAGGQIQADVSIVSQGYAQNYWYPLDVLEPLKTDDLPHWGDLFPYWQKAPFYWNNDQLMAVPNVWGSDSVIHNTEVVPTVDSVAILFDKELSGKIAMPKNGVESVAITAQYLGFENPFNPTEAELAEIKKTLLEQKPLVRTYWESIGDLVNLFTSGEVAVAYGWISVFTQVQDAGIPVAWANPKEGQIGWSNGNAVIKFSEHKELATKFVDFNISPEYLKPMFDKIGYRTTSQVFTETLSAEDRAALQLDDPEGLLSSLVPWITAPPETGRLIDDLWAEVVGA
ncbi:MAG: extracellular solute-binding protein [Thermomicrobiales bacterium]|nr:extracellular solute-binding protein [Thermomicrobiales bacterium]